MDSFFFSLESDTCPMNLGLLITLRGPDQSTCEKRLREAIGRNVKNVARFNQCISSARPGFRQPGWQLIPDLDPQTHIHRHELPTPVNDAQRNALINDLMMTRMRGDDALWEVHVITGGPQDRLTALFKLHHACADGMGSLRLFSEALAGGGSGPWISSTGEAETGPSRLRQSLSWWLTTAVGFLTYPLMWLGVRSYIWRLARNTQKQAAEPDSLFAAPVGPGRSYAMTTLPREQVRHINRQYGSSENELLMTLYAGALRRYLDKRELLPGHSLHVGMTYSIMFSDKRKNASNQASFSQLSLATRTGDPVKRLQQMKKRCARALERKPSATWQQLQNLMQYAAPRLMARTATRFMQLLGQGKIRSRFSAFATYMPGPIRAIDLGDCRVESIHPLGIIYHGASLSLSAMRYGKNIHCGVVADRQRMPDPETFSDLLNEEFETLYRRATAEAH